jgi:hypothetical protein
VIVPLPHGACAQRDDAATADEHAPDNSSIELSREEVLRMRPSVRGDCTRHRAAAAVFVHDADRRKERSPGAVVPGHTRTKLRTAECRQVGPAVVIQIRTLLPVRAAKDAVVPMQAGGLRKPEGGVRSLV